MTRRIANLILTAGFAALLGIPAAFAQTNAEVANVPFTFHAAQKTLAAGKYTVAQDPATGLVALSDATGHCIYITMHPGKASNPDQPKLTFSHQGDQYVLRSLSMPDSNSAWETFPSSSDKVLSRKLTVATTISVPLKSR